ALNWRRFSASSFRDARLRISCTCTGEVVGVPDPLDRSFVHAGGVATGEDAETGGGAAGGDGMAGEETTGLRAEGVPPLPCMPVAGARGAKLSAGRTSTKATGAIATRGGGSGIVNATAGE